MGNSNIVAAVEFGTSKIGVLIGEPGDDGTVNVLGYGERASNDSVCKGEIVNMPEASELFHEALADAESTAEHSLLPEEEIFVGITGAHIAQHKGNSRVPINNEDHIVKEEHLENAIRMAQAIPLHTDEAIIDSFCDYYILDGDQRLENPLNQVAGTIELSSYIITGRRNRIDSFLQPLRDLALESLSPVFTGVASAVASVTDEEHSRGVLLIDMGAGTTEFLLPHKPGIPYSDILPVGCDNIANDLHIALDLPFSPVSRKLFLEYISRTDEEKSNMYLPGNYGQRKIPEQTVSKIIDMRFRETFEIIREKLEEADALSLIRGGIVFTGGGAMVPEAVTVLGDVFNMPVRTACDTVPDKFSGCINKLKSPRYASILGLLEFGVHAASERDSLITRLDKNISGIMKKTFEIFRKSLKL